MTTLYGLILTLCINGQCNQTIPESFYSEADCIEALQQIDLQYGAETGRLFICEAIED